MKKICSMNSVKALMHSASSIKLPWNATSRKSNNLGMGMRYAYSSYNNHF